MNARQKAKVYKKRYQELLKMTSPTTPFIYPRVQNLTHMVVQSQADEYYMSKEMTITQAKNELLRQLVHDVYDKIDVDIDYRKRIVYCKFDFWIKNKEVE